MNPVKQHLAEVLRIESKISVPIYQRQYAWEEERVRTFWDDLLRLSRDKDAAHYMGTMVKKAEATLEGGVQHSLVIDGQQRMTVLMLLAAAIRDYIRDAKGLSAHLKVSDSVKVRRESDPRLKKLHLQMFVDSTYLFYESGGRNHKKFLPTELNDDREVFNHVVFEGEADKRKRHYRHYQLLKECLASESTSYVASRPGENEFEAKVCFLHSVIDALARMEIVYIEVESTDDPQQIFESINHKGEPLTVTDLIRNHVLTLTDERGRMSLFECIWMPMEDCLCQLRDRNEGVVRRSLFDGFFRSYVGMRGKVVPGKQLYSELRTQLEEEIGDRSADTSVIIGKMKNFANYAMTYQTLVWPDAPGADPELKRIVTKFSRLDFTTPMSLLMKFYGPDAGNRPTNEEISAAFSVLENYYVRRALLGRTVKRMSDLFAHLCLRWDKDKPLSSNFAIWLKDNLLDVTSAGDFKELRPVSNNDLKAEIKRARVYANSRTATSFALSEIEVCRSSGGVVAGLNDLDIEHILPQEHASYWTKDLLDWHKSEPDFPKETASQLAWVNDKVDLLRDTLGNLSLTNFNRTLKNFSFERKRDYVDPKSDKEKGYKSSNINLSRIDLGNLPNWTFPQIESRSEKLISELIILYPELVKTEPV